MSARTCDLGDRTTYLGATDIAAIVGVSPYRSPLDVYREKVEGVTGEVSHVMRWGLLMEDAICQEAEAARGYRLVRRNEMRHPDHPFIRIHPDRLVVGQPGLFDAKSTWSHGGYGEPGDDDPDAGVLAPVPPHVRVQMTVYTGVSRREWADVGVVRYRPPLALYRVRHDAALYEACVAEAVRFWHEHVLAKVPPPVDGSEAYGRYLAERFPADDGTELVATPEQALLVEELADAKAAVKAAEARARLAQQRIEEVMGEATALLSPAGKVTWKQQTRAAHVVAESTYRAFRFTPAKGAQEEAA